LKIIIETPDYGHKVIGFDTDSITQSIKIKNSPKNEIISSNYVEASIK
jgi:hypothetical protein